ncbi:hypothetical protein [Proteiniborus sp. MB09-C3]|uniref:hypothetical protein n=1 Tax=Proteiniborus sp. MB09-C3 TaxID=3050072 RepID=UPI0025527A14|nr:hypothetical protein [Proteiniborus sp. MB09-C3]WIV11840.1 hypothetical protein QO263_17310 [Proteiniborus sp. MB09-C3]
MKILVGNQIIEINKYEFKNIVKQYNSVAIDIGTGDGQFIYKRAKSNAGELYIGVDSSIDNMRKYSIKTTKKPSKGGLNNILFVVGNVDDLPNEMTATADKITINLPWGSLRDGLVKGEEIVLSNIKKISKVKAEIDICVTYSTKYEKREIHERELPILSIDFIKTHLKKQYMAYGINIEDAYIWDNNMLKSLDTKWAKKLAYGKEREIFYLKCIVVN